MLRPEQSTDRGKTLSSGPRERQSSPLVEQLLSHLFGCWLRGIAARTTALGQSGRVQAVEETMNVVRERLRISRLLLENANSKKFNTRYWL